MATPSDTRLTDATKKQQSTFAKPEEASEIPKIIVDERKQASSSLPSSFQTSVYSSALPTFGNTDTPCNTKDNGIAHVEMFHSSPATSSNKPIRSSSDIGLPTGNMAYLVPSEGTSSSENNLDVFCSPRTFRRSVDYQISSKEHAFRHGAWLQNLDSSNNCLRVLTSSSRSGSAFSLNSECTARSIGLLSNDSDSDKDISLTDSESMRFKSSQIRRFMSYPDDSSSPELCARSSQSLSDINAMNTQGEHLDLGPGIMHEVLDSSSAVATKLKPVGVPISDGTFGVSGRPGFQEGFDSQNRDLITNNNRGVVRLPSNMLSYKCDNHDDMRDSRIRQWLQDMDSHH